MYIFHVDNRDVFMTVVLSVGGKPDFDQYRASCRGLAVITPRATCRSSPMAR